MSTYPESEMERVVKPQRILGGKKIAPGFIHPSAAYSVPKNLIRTYALSEFSPRPGDIVYGRVSRVGFHSNLENRSGRLHTVNDGSKAVFVYGNRYAPDHYEGLVPDRPRTEVDLLARSGIIGQVANKNSNLKDPTRVRILGHVLDPEGNVLNTRDYSLIKKGKEAKSGARSKLILVVGSSMNSGKSVTAASCCWALSSMGYTVRGSKLTGTASLKDILSMNDAGASVYNDFTHFGHPSTYLLEKEELLRMFRDVDSKFANNAKNFWVVELADGILQRETAMLLGSEEVQARIHRLVFCAGDALGCIGGLSVLKERFGLVPDAISGIVSSAPLARRELEGHSSVTVFDNLDRSLEAMSEVLL
ncbi:MAG: hypothetical protein ACI835_003372 [Planctomycetota bacterium]|jgi:hypothetical protein